MKYNKNSSFGLQLAANLSLSRLDNLRQASIFKGLNRAGLLGIVVLVLLNSGCASHSKSDNVDKANEATTVSKTGPKDPWEGFNRKVFVFNDALDRWILKPVAKGYRWVAPQPVENSVTNFFDNLAEVGNVTNDILQWKWKQAANDTGRFVVNSTIGIVGLWDPAKHMGMKKSDGEDFGQTLAVWGLPQGPYIVLPFLGPNTALSAVTYPADWLTDPVWYITPATDRYAVGALRLIDLRAGLLDVEDLASGDKYTFYRDAYLQRRKFLINDGKVEDTFAPATGEELDF